MMGQDQYDRERRTVRLARRPGRRVYQRPAEPPAAAPPGQQDWGDVARIYDLEHPACRGQELTFWHQAALAAGGDVLELAAGSGRVTIPLARKGHRVTGLELSAGMLERARGRTTRLPEPVQQRLAWVQGDMAAFDLPGRQFGLIFVAYNSFWLLTEERDRVGCLTAARRHLAPGGRLVLDLFPPNRDDYEDEDNIAQLLPARRGGAPILRLKDYRYDPRSRLAASHVRYYAREGAHPGGIGRVFATFTYTLHISEPAEMVALLDRCGFLVEETYGSYDRAPLAAESPRAIFVAQAKD